MDQLIDQYASGGEKLSLAVRGLTVEDLRQVPPAEAKVGLWSIHQLVIHLADAEGAMVDRMKRIIAMDEPALLAWPENAFFERLFYDEQSAEDAVSMIDVQRRQMSRVLRKLPPAAFERAGVHNERGRQTLADVVTFAGWHLDHHLKFVHAKRAYMGKEMW